MINAILPGALDGLQEGFSPLHCLLRSTIYLPWKHLSIQSPVPIYVRMSLTGLGLVFSDPGQAMNTLWRAIGISYVVKMIILSLMQSA